MKIKISEFTSILKDFQTFLDFCEQGNHKLTTTREYLNRKSVHELNQLLEMPAKDVNPSNDQHFYIPIHFYFNIALEADFFQIDRSKKTAFYLIPQKDRIKHFRDLSPGSQYLFIIKTYWVYCDWEVLTNPERNRVSAIAVDRVFEEFSKMETEKIYDKKEHEKIFEIINWSIGQNVLYWELLGWIKVTRDNQFNTKSTYYYETLLLTEFGKTIAKILSEERLLSEWNNPYHETGASNYDFSFADLIGGEEEEVEEVFELTPLPENPSPKELMQYIELLEQQAKKELNIELDLKKFLKESIERGKKPSLEELMSYIETQMVDALPEEEEFENAFALLFSNKTIPALIVKTPIAFKKGRFIFKVSLRYSSKIWRTLELDGTHDLENLHLLIQKAFNFGNDHLYAFYLDKNRRKSYSDPRGGSSPFSDEIELGGLNLKAGQRFFYLFDFGDNWEFNIDVVEIQDVVKKLKKGKILEKNGKAPEQYPDCDEDW